MRLLTSIDPRAHLRGTLAALLLLLSLLSAGVLARAADEYVGKLDPQLIADDDDLEQVICKPFRDLSKTKLPKAIESNATVTAGRLYHALSDKSAILTLLVEPEGEDPFLYVDVDLNNSFDDNERFQLARAEDDDPYVWQTTIRQPLKDGPFAAFPVLVQYYKNVRFDELKEGERLILESQKVFARGSVEIQGKRTIVQYSYNARSKKISATTGRLGVDCDGDGSIDMTPFSAEAAETQDEVVVFRVGSSYVSTKRVDAEKNQILMKSHSASDYKRIELRIGGEVPDFDFTDFRGKKRRLSEFRGKYLLIDFWGMWCPPCRRELPYLKAAYSKFHARGFEILGMNTDEPEIVSQVKSTLDKNGMTWPQARRESIAGLIRNLRIHTYPTTLLIGPDGKIISLNNTQRDEPSLRGRELLSSLDQLLPP
jgi:peroxiredoxin